MSRRSFLSLAAEASKPTNHATDDSDVIDASASFHFFVFPQQ
jgi:hypothetical protein